MSTSQKGFIAPLLLILIAIVLVGGGAYVYVQNKQPAQPTVATMTSQTADWETYTNITYHFSFQYPPSFGTPEEYTGGSAYSVTFLDGRLVVTASIDNNISTGKPMTFSERIAGVRNKKQITVGGRDGIQTSSSQIGTVTMIPLSGNAYATIMGSPDLQNQILPTFKFNP